LTELKTNFEWTEQCQSAFEKCKGILASDLVLMLYNPDLPIVVSADASPVGVGATLSHQVTIDGKIVERPVAYASCSLTTRQQKYSQLDREALGIIFAVTHFHKYIFGRKFTFVTDNNPIRYILSPDKPLPVYTRDGLQRYAVILQAYQFNLVHRKSECLAPADALSRLPCEAEIHEVYNDEVFEELPVSVDDVASETDKDPLLSKVLEYTRLSWPYNERNTVIE